MRRTMAKAAFHTAANLLFFALVGTSMLTLVYILTRDTIAQSIENEKRGLITQIVPATSYDNDIMKDTVRLVPDELLGAKEATTVYRGRMRGLPSIAVLQVTAPDGYSGKIDLIVAVHNDGRVAGVRVVSHNETPGLGDYIDIAKSEWIAVFNDSSLVNRKASDWKVKKDGGAFDYRAGATITPRAIVKAIHKALQYHAQHRDEIFAENKAASAQEKKK